MPATVHVSLATVSARAVRPVSGPGLISATLPVPNSQSRTSETLTSSGSSAPTTITGLLNEVWTVTVTGGNVWVAAGASPDASANPRVLILDGSTRDFGVTASGEKLAVQDVA